MIEQHGLELILKYARPKGFMVELGNQIMNLEFNQGQSAKDYFTQLGFDHVSIDKNGLNGAVSADLSKPIRHPWSADIVTDIGTSEHVSDLYECLRNVLSFCKNGTMMIHKNPLTGHFPEHGFHFYTLEFWKEWADLCNLEVFELYEFPIYHNTETGFETIAVLRFTKDSRIPTLEEYQKIASFVKTY